MLDRYYTVWDECPDSYSPAYQEYGYIYYDSSTLML